MLVKVLELVAMLVATPICVVTALWIQHVIGEYFDRRRFYN
jgi:uncharacterized membrane protein